MTASVIFSTYNSEDWLEKTIIGFSVQTFKEFERIWNKYYNYIINNIKNLLPPGYEDDFMVPKDFKNDILGLLPEAIRNIEVKAINSLTKDILRYPKKYENDFIFFN